MRQLAAGLAVALVLGLSGNVRAEPSPGDRMESLRRQQDYVAAFETGVAELGRLLAADQPDSAAVTDKLVTLAAIAFESGDRFAAGVALVAAVPLARSAGQPVVLADALIWRGLLRRRELGPEAAVADLQEAEQILDALPEAVLSRGRLLQAQANLCRVRLGSATAVPLYQAALNYRLAKLSRPHMDIADNLVWLAWNLREAGRDDEADAAAAEAAAELRALGAAQHSLMSTVLELQFDRAALAGDLAACRRLAEHEVAVYEHAKGGFPFGYARGLACPPGGYRRLMWTMLEQGDFETAFDTWQRFQAPVTRDLYHLERWLNTDGTAVKRELRQQYGRIRDGLVRVRRIGSPPGERLAATVETLRAWSRIQTTIRRRAGAATGRSVDIQEVRSTLKPGTALLGFLAFRIGGKNFMDRTARRLDRWLVVVRPDTAATWLHTWSLTGAELDAALGEDTFLFRSRRRALDWPTRLPMDRELDERLTAQAQAMLGPAIPALDGIDTVIRLGSSLSFIYAYCPGAPANSSVVPTAEILVDLARREHESNGPGSVLVVGADGAGTGRPLANTAAEMRVLADTFPAATVLTDDLATERHFEELAASDALSGFSTIHFACHAWTGADPQQSALVLNDYTDTGEGRLDLGELLFYYDLRPDLVVLSGCSTALGRGNMWGEYHSLAQVFLGKGARQVIASRWDVDDQATQLFMGRFYRELAASFPESSVSREPPRCAVALSKASRWLRFYRDASGRQPYRHPIYWSGFVVYGLP